MSAPKHTPEKAIDRNRLDSIQQAAERLKNFRLEQHDSQRLSEVDDALWCIIDRLEEGAP